MNRVVVALYDTIQDARNAVDALIENGFNRNDISLIAQDEKGEYSRYIGNSPGDGNADETLNDAVAGAGIGAVIGGIGGVLLGLGALTIPGIGPFIAAGPIVAGLTGAGIGAAAGGLIGALTGMGIPEEQAEYYAEGLRRGGTLVTVSTSAQMESQAVAVLDRFNPTSIDQKATEWGMDTDTRQRGMEGDETFDVVEEDLKVGKRQVQTGSVRAHTYVTEQPVEENIREDVDVQRTDGDHYESSFRTHYQSNYANNGGTWDQYRPAYYYGSELASNERYRGRDWSSIEADARRDWEMRHGDGDSIWEDFKDAVRAGWETVTGRR
jgi:hypothetical protein